MDSVKDDLKVVKERDPACISHVHCFLNFKGLILLDHVTGLVVGETAVIGNNVSILHSMTLGGTGKASGDRNPKIGDGVLIDAGTCILGTLRLVFVLRLVLVLW
ncbi:hypothetical protein Ahy_A05g023264 isoform A [Arachis hypogaea]|uniref:Serine acetyltransferase N-terminal domain-containing protein n=1 Tax=Arachis hypogaea TaxID=3818 RepID=A0A445D317_ARAHY|nr:hypothetical protein Ahy_A05g023264 isoform A [Arachis hypogaea]